MRTIAKNNQPTIGMLLVMLLLALLFSLNNCKGNGGDGATVDGGDRTPPTKPTNVVVSSATSTRIDISWTASSDDVGVAEYKLYCNKAYLKSVPTTTTSDAGLAPATRYCYAVRAVDSSKNESNKSDEVCTTTLPDTIPPAIPTGLITMVVSTNQINLAWNANTENDLAGYLVYRDPAFPGLSSLECVPPHRTGCVRRSRR